MPTVVHKQMFVPQDPTANASFPMMWASEMANKAAGWTYAGSSDGTVDKTTNPALDRWNTTLGTLGTLTASGSGAVVAAPARGRSIVTGLTGVVSSWKGQFLKISGSTVSANNNVHQVEEIISSTSVKINARNFAVGADAVGRSWEVRNALGETYPTRLNTVVAWRCEIGPHVLRIPITTAPSARMLPGERVIQTSSSFEGELRSYVWNPSLSTGYLVVMGQVRGTGGGAYGLTTGQVFTGQTSGATVTQNGTGREFRFERVISKATNMTTGSVFCGMFEVGVDTSFSSLVASAGCTATVQPGGGGTGNSFPTYGWVAWGSITSPTGNFVRVSTTGDPQGHFAVCADAIEEAGYSADGSCMAGTYSRQLNTWMCQGVQLCDGGEAGDVVPWLSFSPMSAIFPNTVTTNIANVVGRIGSDPVGSCLNDMRASGNTTYSFLRGWIRRGFGDASDVFMMYEPALPMVGSLTIIGAGAQASVLHTRSAGATNGANSSNGSYSQTHEGLVPVLQPIYVGNFRTTQGGQQPASVFKQHKGAFRWVKIVDGGHTNTLHDLTFLQLTGFSDSLCVGPFGGVAPTIATPAAGAGRMYLGNWAGSPGTISCLSNCGTDILADGTLINSAAGVPANPGGAQWESGLTTDYKRMMLQRNRGGFNTSNVFRTFVPTASATTACYRFISSPIAAQTISGTITGQCMASLSVAGTAYLAARLYVITPAGTIRGVLRELLTNGDTSGGTAVTTATVTNRKIFRASALTTLAVLAGDRLVLELGAMLPGAAGFNFRLSVTDDATIDLQAGDETLTTIPRAGWIEFSTPVTFLDVATEVPVLIGGTSTIGGSGYTLPSGGSSDAIAPTFGSFSPASGAISTSQPISITANDETKIAIVTAWVEYTNLGLSETIYDGNSFKTAFSSSTATPSGTPDTTAVAFVLTRTGGWLDDAFVLKLQAVDAGGNTTIATASYTLTTARSPTFSAYSPASGAVSVSQAINITVSDSIALNKVIVRVTYANLGRTETIYDGSALVAPYTTNSTVTPTGSTALAFSLRRNNGWPDSFTIKILAIDAQSTVSTSTSATYTLSASAAPTFSAFNPVAGNITYTTPIGVTVNDSTQLLLITAWVVYGTLDYTELMYNGSSFEPSFSGSSATPSGLTSTAFSFVPDNGWLDNTFLIKVMATDADGTTTTTSSAYTLNPSISDLGVILYLNRVHDTVASKTVYWVSNHIPDSSGALYPGPGTFGVTTNNYVVVKKL